jgi:hypothetical protein
LGFDFFVLTPRTDYDEHFRMDRVELMVNERARRMLYRKQAEFIMTTVS